MLTTDNLQYYISGLKDNDVNLISLHWTVGLPNQLFDNAYHFQIIQNGNIHVDPRAFDSGGNFVPLAHAWHHNSKNIGISVCGMYGATQPSVILPTDPTWSTWSPSYGSYPPSSYQMKSMVFLISQLVRHYNLTLEQVKSHYDLSLTDGYKGERWEWMYEKEEILMQVTKELG